MKTRSITPASVRSLAGLVAISAILLPHSQSLLSQELRPNGGAGWQYPLHSVPAQEPRAPEGSDASEKWRTHPDDQPVASLVNPLRTNDAVLEVVVGQGRLLTLKTDLINEQGSGIIAVADPTVLDFQVLSHPRMIRLIGKRAGMTDLSITTPEGQTVSFEVHVVYDIELLRAYLKQTFPSAQINLRQLREHLVIEGQARSGAQITQILQTTEAFLASVQVPSSSQGSQSGGASSGRGGYPPPNQPQQNPDQQGEGPEGQPQRPRQYAGPETGGAAKTQGSFVAPRIINLMRVPGVQQVMLKVQIAELNRTAAREIGADILMVDPGSGTILGTQIAGSAVSALGLLGQGGLTGTAEGATSSSTAAFGIFPSGDFEVLLRALRRNGVLSIMAEPNLVAMNGQEASFLAGGQFPVPVPQTGGGNSNAITIEWKDFGVQLGFVPSILDDRNIRLKVAPEVSSIDESLGTEVLGTAVPGVNTRKLSTTVELQEGQTLALAGLLEVELEAQTSRIPLLGDIPYLGQLFSNNTNQRVEKELLVLVTPQLVAPMRCDEVPPLPTDTIQEPNDLEFYLLGRIEGRTGRPFRSTTAWDDPLHMTRLMNLDSKYLYGSVGFSE